MFYPELLEERLESSGLSADVLGRFRRLLYPRGSWLLFSDPTAITRTLEPDDRLRFMKMLHRRVTHMANLVIDAETDIDAMVAYWSYPGRAKGLRPLFESLARVPGGGSLDVAHVLPQFARKRIYTYPEPSSDPVVQRRDCIWTSFNFFNETPDDRFTDPGYTVQALAAEYEQVHPSAARFGDIVIFRGPRGETVHASVYIADDLMFTKNGATAAQPWMFMKLDAMLDLYSVLQPERLRAFYFRNKAKAARAAPDERPSHALDETQRSP
jgi:hypothetical protein